MGNIRDSNEWSQIMVLPDVSAFMHLVHILKEGCFALMRMAVAVNGIGDT
jgi:hypothetical protein